MNFKVKFGRVPSPFDHRDFSARQFMPGGVLRSLSLALPSKKQWSFPLPALNQGNTPHCVGFSMADFGICETVFRNYTNADAHAFYSECKKVDGYAGDGSTIRAAAKVMKAKGIVDAYAFASSGEDVKWWLLNKSPVIVGIAWTSDMMKPDATGLIIPTGSVLGGHAVCLTGFEDGYFYGMNSWGTTWGARGRFRIAFSHFDTLLRHSGEALVTVELEPKPAPAPAPAPAPSNEREERRKKQNKKKGK